MAARPRKGASEAAADDAPESAVAPEPAPVGRVQIRKKDFVDRVADRSGVRKADTRTAIEAALALMAEMLVAGEELNLPPLGKLKVTRVKDNPRGKVLMVRLMHQPAAHDEHGTRPLAEM
ncbi:MAG: DNA-binding protein [Rhodobacterales bacterium]|nr:DNA-binding protein [Rhodobacterales bacterium]NCT13131.1 DNA-binding protein [Rhodobacterales bacterium]